MNLIQVLIECEKGNVEYFYSVNDRFVKPMQDEEIKSKYPQMFKYPSTYYVPVLTQIRGLHESPFLVSALIENDCDEYGTTDTRVFDKIPLRFLSTWDLRIKYKDDELDTENKA